MPARYKPTHCLIEKTQGGYVDPYMIRVIDDEGFTEFDVDTSGVSSYIRMDGKWKLRKRSPGTRGMKIQVFKLTKWSKV